MPRAPSTPVMPTKRVSQYCQMSSRDKNTSCWRPLPTGPLGLIPACLHLPSPSSPNFPGLTAKPPTSLLALCVPPSDSSPALPDPLHLRLGTHEQPSARVSMSSPMIPCSNPGLKDVVPNSRLTQQDGFFPLTPLCQPWTTSPRLPSSPLEHGLARLWAKSGPPPVLVQSVS